jgi:methionyl-tRNA formyltransferase
MTRVIYLGQKPLGERCFDLLCAALAENLRLVGVVSNSTDQNWWGSCRVFDGARRRRLPLLDNATRNDQALEALIRAERADLLVSVQHPWILPAGVLEAVNRRALNLHLAPLPAYRGYHSCNHAILNGEKVFGVTMHWMSAKVDAGEVAYAVEFPVPPDVTACRLYAQSVEAGETVFRALLKDLRGHRLPPRRALAPGGRFYGRGLLAGLRRIRNPADPLEVDRKARAFFYPPFEAAYILAAGRKYYLTPPAGAPARRGVPGVSGKR